MCIYIYIYTHRCDDHRAARAQHRGVAAEGRDGDEVARVAGEGFAKLPEV